MHPPAAILPPAALARAAFPHSPDAALAIALERRHSITRLRELARALPPAARAAVLSHVADLEASLAVDPR